MLGFSPWPCPVYNPWAFKVDPFNLGPLGLRNGRGWNSGHGRGWNPIGILSEFPVKPLRCRSFAHADPSDIPSWTTKPYKTPVWPRIRESGPFENT